jgi:hypothetical protein
VTTPTLHEYVQAFLTSMRARPKERTQFGPAGRATIRTDGERVLLGPRGEKIRVVENPLGGTQIEHGDHLHAVVRPETVRIRVSEEQFREITRRLTCRTP